MVASEEVITMAQLDIDVIDALEDTADVLYGIASALSLEQCVEGHDHLLTMLIAVARYQADALLQLVGSVDVVMDCW